MKSSIFVFLAIFACLALAAEDCPSVCTADYRPVCGENASGGKRTFPNRCTMDVFNCENKSNAYQEIKSSAC